MKSNDSNCFETRKKSENIVFAGGGAAATDPIPTGSTVILHCQDAQIRVVVTDAGPKQSYEGNVLSIECDDNDTDLPCQIGSDVEFKATNIFTCENLAAAA